MKITFRNADEAIYTILKEGPARPLSAEAEAAYDYLMENGPQEIKDEFQRIFNEVIGIRPAFYDEHGNGYVPLDEFKEKLGLTDEQVEEMIRDCEAKQKGRTIPASARIHSVH